MNWHYMDQRQCVHRIQTCEIRMRQVWSRVVHTLRFLVSAVTASVWIGLHERDAGDDCRALLAGDCLSLLQHVSGGESCGARRFASDAGPHELRRPEL